MVLPQNVLMGVTKRLLRGLFQSLALPFTPAAETLPTLRETFTQGSRTEPKLTSTTSRSIPTYTALSAM